MLLMEPCRIDDFASGFEKLVLGFLSGDEMFDFLFVEISSSFMAVAFGHAFIFFRFLFLGLNVLSFISL